MDTKQLYEERLTRYVTANYNEKPDRIPLRIFAEELASKYCGYTNFEVAVKPELQFDVNRRFAVEMGTDAIQTNSVVNWFGMQKALGWDGITFPGIGIPADSINQWWEPTTEEEAFLKAAEYDELIDDPTAFLINKWMPRFMRHVRYPGEPSTFEQIVSLIDGLMAYNHFFSMWAAKTGELIDSGVVPAVGSVLKAPLDILGDKLRGYINLCYDLNQRRDKVIEACQALMPHLANLVIGGADPSGCIPSIIWMHRGCVPFISHQDFDEIYWPTLKPIIEELWARGSQIILYAEGNWDHHLETFAELPEKSIIFHCDRTNIYKAHEILGNKFCISGGISNVLLTTGTPEEVKAECKKVIDAVAQDGGYVMDAGALIMNDAKIENVRAMIEFTREYGVYDSDVSTKSLDELTNVPRPEPSMRLSGVDQKRPPGVVFPWSEKRKELPDYIEDEELTRQVWEQVDGMGWGFCWVSLTW